MRHEQIGLKKEPPATQASHFKPGPVLNAGIPQSPLMQHYRNIGNQAVQRMLETRAVQAKLTIGPPNDVYEQEADRVADQVMRMPEPKQSLVNGHWSLGKTEKESSLVQRQSRCPGCQEEEELIQTKPLAEQITPLVQRKPACPECTEEEDLIQTKGDGSSLPGVTSGVESYLETLKGGGQPLSESTRSFFEPRFGVDFSQVRVHADSNATGIARSINAKAFTTGKDVILGEGQYTTETSTGKSLLAHELTHVVQQQGGGTLNSITPVSKLAIQRACTTRNTADCTKEDLLTAVCIGEAGNISNIDGKKGVINVVMNRVADSAFPNTIHAVTTATGQFNGLDNGIRHLNDPSFSECRVLAQEVMRNPANDPTLGALWFNQSCSKDCSQYCTTYLGDGSSQAHYFARRATADERRACQRSRSRRERHCCDNPRTRISYITFTEAEVDTIVVPRPTEP